MEKEIYFKATEEGQGVQRIKAIVSVFEYQLVGEEYESIAKDIAVTYYDNRKHLVLYTYDECVALVHEVLQARVCEGREIEEGKVPVAGRGGAGGIRWLGGKQTCRMVRYAMGCEMKEDQYKPLAGGQGKGPLQLDPGLYGLWEQKQKRDGLPKLFFRSAECPLLIRGDDGGLVKWGDKKMKHCMSCQDVYRGPIRKRLERKKGVRELDEVDFYELANMRSVQEENLREKLGDARKENKAKKRKLKKLTKFYEQWQAERRNVRVEMTDGSIKTLIVAMKTENARAIRVGLQGETRGERGCVCFGVC
jgi:hypothetical protein